MQITHCGMWEVHLSCLSCEAVSLRQAKHTKVSRDEAAKRSIAYGYFIGSPIFQVLLSVLDT